MESEGDSVGLKVTVEITHPEWILFGDKVGTDISQKDDGNVGDKNSYQRKVVEKISNQVTRMEGLL